MAALQANNVRKAYLITYSKADLERFDRESFARAVIRAFEAVATAFIVQWACCMEQHKDEGVHFHMCVLLSKLQRWSMVKKYLQEFENVVVNFSGHTGYYTAYQYVIKEDTEVLRSENHPLSVPAPKTLPAMRKRTGKGKSLKNAKKRLTNLDVSSIITSNGIDSKLHLLALAKKKQTDGDSRLYEFVLNRGEKRVNELIQSVWAMETAQQTLERRSMSRIDVLKKAYNDKCVCQGEWLECAKEILHNNGIEQNIFAHAIVKLLAMGRGKGRNIYITGPANCGKTFILDPLRIIYKTFVSPATCSYAWLGVEDTEVIFLNDFRYTPAILPWSDMLLLLEGHVVHFAAPKTSYARDIEFTSDTPVFATSKSSIVFIKGSVLDEKETEMMDVRWKKFNFYHQIPISSQKTVTPCGCCFAKLLLDVD